VIRSFRNQGTEDVFNGKESKAARRTCPLQIAKVARRKLDQLDSVDRLNQMAIPPQNRLQALKGDRKGQHAVRINDQYRICFRWTGAGPEDVEITDYH
jgi:proteic killer suppression protein